MPQKPLPEGIVALDELEILVVVDNETDTLSSVDKGVPQIPEVKGVVIILNVTDLAAANEMLEKLPLRQANLMSFELIPLGPLAPLRRLTGMDTKP